MTLCTYFGYHADDLKYDPMLGAFSLRTQIGKSVDRLRFDICFVDQEPAQKALDGKENSAFQKVEGDVFNAAGIRLGSGAMAIKDIELWCPIADDTMSLYEIKLSGRVIGYVPTGPLQTDIAYPCVQAMRAPEFRAAVRDANIRIGAMDTRKPVEQSSPATCFGPGTMITTDQGEIPVEWLDTSDKVLTRDHGFQPVRWVGRTRLSPGYFRQDTPESPIRIPAGALGNGTPTHDLHITGNHRLLLRAPHAEAEHGAAEVLAPAKAWEDLGRAEAYLPEKTYTITNVLCAEHEIILAQGTWVESMFPCENTIGRLSAGNRAQFEMILGKTLYDMQSARPSVSRQEAYALIEQSRTEQGGRMPDTVRKRA